MSHYGIDVSSNNDHPLDFGALYTYLFNLGNAQPFAIVKVNQGTGYTNPDAAADIAGLSAAGFAVGGYLMDEGTADPTSEQAMYNAIAAAIPQFDDDELPDGLSTAQYIAHLNQLIAQKPSIQYLNQSEVAAGYNQSIGLWLAQYNNTPGVTAYPCLIHQYNNVGTIPNCAGVFDLNVWCGSEAQFNSTFNLTPVPDPPEVDDMTGITPSIITPDGTRHRFSIFMEGLGHYWLAKGQTKWLGENVAQIAGNKANPPSPAIAALAFDEDQVPVAEHDGTVLVVAAVTTDGIPWEFDQSDGTAGWGAAQILS